MWGAGGVSVAMAEDVAGPRESGWGREAEAAGTEEEEGWADLEEEMAELLDEEGGESEAKAGRSRSPSPLPPRHPSESCVKRRRSGGDCGGREAGKLVKLQRNASLSEWMGASPPPDRPTYSNTSTSARSPSVEFRPPLGSSRDASPVLNLGNTTSTPVTVTPSGDTAGKRDAAQAEKSPLEVLPYEVLRRVMCCLSADGLATLAQTSRQLRSFSTDNSLWRRLYLGRWKLPDAHQLKMHRDRGALSWAGYYKDRDVEESRKNMERLPEEMREAVAAMNQARRKTTISLASGSGQSGDLAFADASEADKVVEWRRKAGKPDRVPFHTCLTTHPAGPPCQYVCVGDAMVCQRSGWAHVCEDTCAERIPSPSGMMVCPISGRCFEMLVEDEEDAGRCGEVHDDDFHFGERGSLGRSFEAGYSCSNERDLQWFCGARLR